MKSKKLLLFAVAAAFAAATLPVAAQLSGNYAVTGETSCLFSTLGFNANLTPVSGSTTWVNSFSSRGIAHFRSNGTASGQYSLVEITHPPHPPSADSEDFTLSSIYSFSDGVLTVQTVSLEGTFTAGPDSGLGYTFTVNPPPLTGWVAKNGSVVLTSGTATVETFTIYNSSGGVVFSSPRICHRTRTEVPLD